MEETAISGVDATFKKIDYKVYPIELMMYNESNDV